MPPLSPHLRAWMALATVWAFALQAGAADVTLSVGSTTSTLKPLLSVNAGPTPPNNTGGPDYTLPYQRMGVQMVRTHDFFGPLDMPTMYPDRSKDPALQSSYNFTTPAPSPGSPSGNPTISSDAAFRAIQAGNFGVYFRLGDSAGNIKSPSDAERANWVKAAVNVLKHYSQGQWNGFTTTINYVEIGNEPDSTGFWTGTPTQFYQLYVDTAKAIRAEFPTIKIGGPGVTQTGFLQPAGQTWVSNFLATVKAQGAPLDFFSWHLYSNDPAAFTQGAAYYRDLLNRNGFTATESHITEWNNEGSGTSAAANAEYRSKAKGAAITTAAWVGLNESAVDRAFFYDSADMRPDDSKQYGMFTSAGDPKPAALAFSLWGDMSRYGSRLPVTLSGSGASAIKAMAAKRADGALAILIANTGTTTLKWAASLADGSTLQSYQKTLKTLSDASPMLSYNTAPATEIDLAPGTVQMLLLHTGGQSFDVAAKAFGKLSHHYASLEVPIAAADRGLTRNFYTAANVGGLWFFYSGGNWVPWTGGAMPATSTGPLPGLMPLPVVSGLNLSAAPGASIYVGYGSSETEMLSAGRYKLAYTLPAQ